MGCRIRTLRRTGRLALGLHWKMPPHGPIYRTQERTGLADTASNRRILERDFCQPIAAEMWRRGFDLARYLTYFPHGARADEFRLALGHAPVAALPTTAPLSVADYFDVWFARMREPHVRRSLIRDYRQHFTAYILPAIGNEALAELRLAHLVALRDGLSERLSPKTVRNIMAGSLKALLRDAQNEGLSSARALFPSLKLGPGTHYQPDPMSVAERAELIAYYRTYQSGRHLPFVLTLALTGMRPSEATALQIGTVDAARRTITIIRSRNLGVEFELPKTRKSRRTIPIVDELAAVLAPLLEGRPDRHVFLHARGGPLNQDNWRADHWAPALEACEIRHRDLYALRDTFISAALSEGAPLMAVSGYCGTSPQVIGQSYGKYIPREPRGILAFVQGVGEAKMQPPDDPVAVSSRNPARSGASPTGFELVPRRARRRHTLDENRNQFAALLRVVGRCARAVA